VCNQCYTSLSKNGSETRSIFDLINESIRLFADLFVSPLQGDYNNIATTDSSDESDSEEQANPANKNNDVNVCFIKRFSFEDKKKNNNICISEPILFERPFLV